MYLFCLLIFQAVSTLTLKKRNKFIQQPPQLFLRLVLASHVNLSVGECTAGKKGDIKKRWSNGSTGLGTQ